MRLRLPLPVLHITALTSAISTILFGAAYRYEWLWTVWPSAQFQARALDVSHHQGPIDWAAIRAGGWSGVWIKATEGATWVDPRFRENHQGAQAAGVRRGAYHFYGFCSDPADQAAHFLATLGADPGELIPALDVESGGNCSKRPSPAELRAGTDRFLSIVEAAIGRRPLLYLIADDIHALFGEAGPPPADLWLRDLHREPSPPAGRQMRLWQYHVRGWVGGIAAFTDINAFPGDDAAFAQALSLRASSAP